MRQPSTGESPFTRERFDRPMSEHTPTLRHGAAAPLGSSGVGGRPLGRRGLLGGGLAVGAAALVARFGFDPVAAGAPVVDGGGGVTTSRRDPFTLGVASGDPLPGGFVLWTRLAPDPLAGGGMPNRPAQVVYEIARTPDMRRPVRRGAFVAVPQEAHSVHVEVAGLDADTEYFYRFRSGSHLSPIGRVRTMPRVNADPQAFALAFVSCNDFQNGYWPALAGLADDDVDLILHLGDAIYEYDPASAYADRRHVAPETLGVGSSSGQLTTLSDFRNRHAQYKTDPAMQAAMARCAWSVTWDDHEAENNYAGFVDEVDPRGSSSVADFALERAAAYRAYWEHMPLRSAARPRGAWMTLYRRLRIGRLAELNVLDTRQYRTDQEGDGSDFGMRPLGTSSESTLLGARQQRWLLEGLAASDATWNVLAQQVMYAPFRFAVGAPAPFHNLDAWDGYTANRDVVSAALQRTGVANPVVLTGDIHSSWVQDVHAVADDATSPVIATEFVGTSVSSDFPLSFIPLVRGSMPLNPQTRYFDGARRGYVRCTLTPQTWRTDFRTVATITTADAPVSTTSSWVVENGRPGAEPA